MIGHTELMLKRFLTHFRYQYFDSVMGASCFVFGLMDLTKPAPTVTVAESELLLLWIGVPDLLNSLPRVWLSTKGWCDTGAN